MKLHERCLAGILALGLLATACTSDGDAVAGATPDAEPTAVPTALPTEPTPEPTPDPRDSVIDEDLINGALAQLELDVAVGSIRSVKVYDVLDTTITENDEVTITICSWSGDTVFDQVRDSLYRTSVAADGTITATHVTTPVATGECLNTELIKSALDHINQFDAFSVEVSSEPSSFFSDPRQWLLTDQVIENLTETFEGFVADGVYLVGTRVTGPLAETAIDELLWRRFQADDLGLVEVAACRPMDPERGTYRDGVLLDDGRSETSPGLHSIDSFQLVPDKVGPTGWQIAGRSAIIWTDCFFVNSWPETANVWQPRDVDFEVLEP